MSKLRVYELAKELNIKPQDVLDSLQGTQYEVKTSSNSIDEDAQKLVRSKVNGAAKPAAETKTAAEKKRLMLPFPVRKLQDASCMNLPQRVIRIGTTSYSANG